MKGSAMATKARLRAENEALRERLVRYERFLADHEDSLGLLGEVVTAKQKVKLSRERLDGAGSRSIGNYASALREFVAAEEHYLAIAESNMPRIRALLGGVVPQIVEAV